jgi:hypothetical protein
LNLQKKVAWPAGLLRKAPERLATSEKERLEAVFKKHPVLRLVHAEMHEFRGCLIKSIKR